MSSDTVDAQIQVVVDGKTTVEDVVQLPADKHYKLELMFTQVPCTCPTKHPKETSMLLSTPEDLDTQPVGAVAADKEHDDWVKTPGGGWTHKDGPVMRSKTLVSLWGPLLLVRVPETSLAA